MSFERIKERIKRGKGYNPEFETYDPDKLGDLAMEMTKLVIEINEFTEALREDRIIPSEPSID